MSKRYRWGADNPPEPKKKGKVKGLRQAIKRSKQQKKWINKRGV